MVERWNFAIEFQHTWILGVLLASLASLVSNLGVLIQKLHHLRAEEEANVKDTARSTMAHESFWWLGLFLVFFGSLADFAALSFSPQSLIAPLASLTLVSNTVFAPLLLGEVITARSIISTLCIVVGSTISVIFASHSDIVYTDEELFSFFLRREFGAYVLVVFMFLVVQYVYIARLTHTDPFPFDFNFVFDSRKLRFAFASISGTIGAQSVLLAKCGVELLVNWFHGRGGLSFAMFMIFAAMFCCIILQIKWLNQGLKLFDASYVVPVFTAFWIVLSVIAGLVFYREIDDMTFVQQMFFTIGVAMTLTGVATLSGQDASSLDKRMAGKARGMDSDAFARVDSPLDDGDESEGPGAPAQTRPTVAFLAQRGADATATAASSGAGAHPAAGTASDPAADRGSLEPLQDGRGRNDSFSDVGPDPEEEQEFDLTANFAAAVKETFMTTTLHPEDAETDDLLALAAHNAGHAQYPRAHATESYYDSPPLSAKAAGDVSPASLFEAHAL